MEHDLLTRAAQALRSRRRQKRWMQVVSVLACVVVFCTTYALILPAITLEGTSYCGIEEHVHDEACYEQQLICQLSTDVHTHDESCHTQQQVLVCTTPEAEAHTHTDGCKKTEQTLTCTQNESAGHTHTDTCMTAVSKLTCTLPETAGHTHGEGCHDGDGSLICPEVEAAAHTHGEGCYTVTQQPACGQEESEGHTHGESCYTQTETIACGLEETAGHAHGESCYEMTDVLQCQLEEGAAHIHGDKCYEEVMTCLKEEHEHTVGCYSDPNADLETQAGWERTLPEELSGVWADDVLAIAESQLGYAESTRNYQVDPESGDLKGYNRYGAWYGDPYGHWCAMFASFCIDYAGVEGFPLESGCQRWIDALSEEEYGCYRLAGDYVPEPGDLIFFDTNRSSTEDEDYADHVGLVVEITEEGEIKTIEGNSGDQVRYRTYAPDDETILGYGLLPEEPTEEVVQPETIYYCGLEAHAHGENCYDAEGGLICTLEEHEHTADCEVMPPVTVYYCGLEAHTHGEDCYDAEGGLICTLEEHEHTADCEVLPETPIYYCGLEAHSHGEDCYDTEGGLACALEEHTHNTLCVTDPAVFAGLSEEELEKVKRVILLIDEMPSADEIDAKIAEFEEAEDYEGEEVWLTEIYQLVGDVYFDYQILGEALQPYVVNADKLLELEYIWSASLLIDDISSDAPQTVQSASTAEFIELNLYDYDSGVNANYNGDTDWPGFQWNGGAYHNSGYMRQKIDYIDFGNSMITDFEYGSSSASGDGNGKSSNAQNIGNQGGNINKIVEYPSGDYANKPVGFSTGTEVLSRTLTAAGYPWVINAGSMVDYFSDSAFATKLNTASIDGLFQRDETTGEYYYNSRWNHAQYSNNKFTLYQDIITPNFITYPFGNFLPLNDITDGNIATQVSHITSIKTYVQETINELLVGTVDSTEQQLVDMLAMYRADLQSDSVWTTWDAKDAIVDYFTTSSGNNPTDDVSPISDSLLEKMYNIDWDVDTNFFFGMEMKMNFIQPKDGMTGNDTNNDGEPDYPMVFYFTGDDDVWVYIDGVLFLDLSGIHRHVGGKIDFVNGKVYYYYLNTETGDVSTTPYATYTFAELLEAAGKSTDGLNSKGTFADYTTHSFNFYYMERGSGSSVCRLNFNFPLLRQNSISVSKEVSSDTKILGDPDYKFQVLKANSDGSKTDTLFIAGGTSYTIYDQNDNKIGTGTTDANGVFTLKAGQRAEFGGIKENAGKYYVRELLEGTVLEQYGNVTVSGESTTTSGSVTVGSETFTGMDSPVKDMSDGATAFRFTNDVDEDELGDLSVSKKLTEYPKARVEKTYDIQVTLDGTLLPVGTEYTVGSETRTVTTAGIITIAADETAVISNILAGTEFTVQETSGSAQGYTVTYSENGGYTVEIKDGKVSGIIKTSANVQLVVTNSEKGATVTIPGTKSVANPDDGQRTFTFRMDEVTDSTGATLKEGGLENYTATVNYPAETDFSFTVNYVQAELGTLPATFYYRITEADHEDTAVNGTAYVAEVTVSETTDGIAAAVTRMWKDGAEITDSGAFSADFTNTLVGDLELSKRVVGATGNPEFTFTIALEVGDSGLTELPESYAATFYQQDGSTAETTVTVNEEGTIKLTGFKDGEKAVIHDIPYGAKWTITEAAADGYVTHYRVNDGEEKVYDTTSGGNISVGTTTVAYTNSTTYELPETGGPGTWFCTLGGLLMTAGAFMWGCRLRRKRERGTAS